MVSMTKFKELKVRWSDLDANGHMANTTYQSFAVHTRFELIEDQGISIHDLLKKGIGLMLFYEHTYYFREFLPMETLMLSSELTGLSQEGRFFRFRHNFYKKNGQHAAFSEALGGWIDLERRKILSNLPTEIAKAMENIVRSEDFKVLTKQDIRYLGVRPKDLKI